MPSLSFRISFSWSSLPWLQSLTSLGLSVSLPSSLPKQNYNIESTLPAAFLDLVVEVEDFKEHVWSHVSIRSLIMNQFSYLLFGKTFFDTFQCLLETIPLLKNHLSYRCLKFGSQTCHFNRKLRWIDSLFHNLVANISMCSIYDYFCFPFQIMRLVFLVEVHRL